MDYQALAGMKNKIPPRSFVRLHCTCFASGVEAYIMSILYKFIVYIYPVLFSFFIPSRIELAPLCSRVSASLSPTFSASDKEETLSSNTS